MKVSRHFYGRRDNIKKIKSVKWGIISLNPACAGTKKKREKPSYTRETTISKSIRSHELFVLYFSFFFYPSPITTVLSLSFFFVNLNLS